MHTHHEIKRFIRQTLGCSCPDKVFDRIEHENSAKPAEYWDTRLRVGGRLLVYILDADATLDLPSTICRSVEQGVTERNRDGFNRFRLVLHSASPNTIKLSAEQALGRSAYKDDRVHLHILEQGFPLSSE